MMTRTCALCELDPWACIMAMSVRTILITSHDHDRCWSVTVGSLPYLLSNLATCASASIMGTGSLVSSSESESECSPGPCPESTTSIIQ